MRVHLGERDCSVQRRHQKLDRGIAGAGRCPRRRARPAQGRAGRGRRGELRQRRHRRVPGRRRTGHFYFIEMNTRIQVEHPVTEMITGIDLIREQIRIAAGEPLGYRQDAVRFDGHAIECRVNAEDPVTFAPSAGRVTAWLPPGGFGVRVDSHLMAPYAVPPFYDSLLAKIIVHGRDRAEAIARMRRALVETVVEGVKTTIPFHLQGAGRSRVRRGRLHERRRRPPRQGVDGSLAVRHPRPHRGPWARPRRAPGRGSGRRLPHDPAARKGVAVGPGPAAGRAAPRACAAAGVTFIVNDRVDLALAVGADGVHLGQDDLPARAARPLLRPGMILGDLHPQRRAGPRGPGRRRGLRRRGLDVRHDEQGRLPAGGTRSHAETPAARSAFPW